MERVKGRRGCGVHVHVGCGVHVLLKRCKDKEVLHFLMLNRLTGRYQVNQELRSHRCGKWLPNLFGDLRFRPVQCKTVVVTSWSLLPSLAGSIKEYNLMPPQVDRLTKVQSHGPNAFAILQAIAVEL